MAIKSALKPVTRIPARRFGRIGVLMGGPSSEREISLKSGYAVYESLNSAGFEVVPVDVTTDKKSENIRLIKSRRIDCAFLALHGRFGEDGQMQEILDAMRIPYTGSGAYASRLAMDKVASRRIFEVYGLAVPRYKVLSRFSYNPLWHRCHASALPVVVKPSTNGSSIGLSIVDKKEDLTKATQEALAFDEIVVVEEYVQGRELTVGILDDKALPVIEIIPKKRFFDYEAKYQHGMTEYVVPAPLDEEVAFQIQRTALIAHKLLGCYGCSRVDVILDQNAVPVILEVNTIPGFTETSLLPKAAKKAGIGFSELCLKLITLAYEKD